MKNSTAGFIALILLLAVMAGVIAWNVSIWNECRADHTWGYCMRLISK